MTTPGPPDGAFVIGGGDYKYGQDLSEAQIRQMFVLPAPNPLNALNLLREQLGRLPLEALQMFKDLIPDPIEAMFETVGGAVDAIMGALTNNPVFLAISTFHDFLNELWNDPAAVIGSIGQNLVEGLVDLASTVGQQVQDFTDFLAELWANPGAVIEQIGQDLVDGLQGALGDLNTMWNQLGDIVQGLIVTPITDGVARFQEWWGSITQGVQQTVDDAAEAADDLWTGLMRVFGIGKSSSDVSNAAYELSQKTKESIDLGEWNNAILGVRQNKHIMQGVDETEESTFLMSDLFNGTSTPPYVNATATNVPIAFWRAAEWAKKGFISWFGEGNTNITALYIDVYKMNYETSVLELIHTSVNLFDTLDTVWKYQVYYLPTAGRFEVFPGDVIGIALRVVGTGTHKVCGKSAPWLPAHPTVVPAKPSATRTGSGNLAFGSITYSTDLPWFGIGIVEGDTPPLFFTPRSTAVSTAGTTVVTIPEWAQFLDVTMIGAGGGGHGGNAATVHGEGGDAGTWVSETLERGVDFPVGATSISVTVGAGGAGGDGSPSLPGGNGGATVREAIASGKAAVTAAGGEGGTLLGNSISEGDAAGNHTYNGTTYIGGGTAASNSMNQGQTGKSPGGGGGGGAGGFIGGGWSGGAGGRGGAWVTARQS